MCGDPTDIMIHSKPIVEVLGRLEDLIQYTGAKIAGCILESVCGARFNPAYDLDE